MTPLRTGIALAITVGLFYALCTLIWALGPGPFLSFMILLCVNFMCKKLFCQ